MIKVKNTLVLMVCIFLSASCAGLTEHDKYVFGYYERHEANFNQCTKNAKSDATYVACFFEQEKAYREAPESYLKNGFIKYSKKLKELHLKFFTKKISYDDFSRQYDLIIKDRNAELLSAAEGERSRRDADFLRRLGNAAQAYNESMRQQQGDTIRCKSQADGIGGVSTVCN